MSDIKIEMDISSVVEGTARLLGLNKKQREALELLTRTTTHLNEEGKASAAYIDQQVSASQRLVSVIRNLGTDNESTTRKIVATTQAIQRQRDAVQALLSSGNRTKVGDIAGKFGESLTSQELARIERIKTAIGKLDTGVVDPKGIKEFFGAIKKGEIPEATGALAKLRDELVKLNNVRTAVKAREKREADLGGGGLSDSELARRASVRARNFGSLYNSQLTNPIAQAFNIDPDKLTLANEAQIRKIGSNISKIIRKSIGEDPTKIIDQSKIKNLVPDLLAGKKLEFLDKPELQAASDQVAKLISLFERLKKAQDSVNVRKANAASVSASNTAAASAAATRAADFRTGFEQNFTQELERQFKIKNNDLTVRQEGVLRNASSNISKLIAGSSSGLDQTKVQDTFNKIRAGGVIQAPVGSEEAKLSAELTKLIGLYERLRQERDRGQRTDQNALNQRLLSDREAREIETRSRSIGNAVTRNLGPIRTQLQGIDPSLDIVGKAGFTKLIRQIGELGQKSGLSQREVVQLYGRLNDGSLTEADGKYRRLIGSLEKLNGLLRTTAKEANAASVSSGKGGISPSSALGRAGGGGDGILPPKDADVGRAKEYSGIFQKIRDGLEYFLVYKGFNLITTQLQSAFDAARKFQVQISLIRTISQDNQKSFQKTGQEILAVSNKSGLSLEDVGKAAYDTISNQTAKGSQLPKFLATASDFARTTGSTLQDSVNLLSSAINSYGLDVEDAEQIAAKFFKTIDLGRIKASDIANTYGRVAFTARDLGVSMDEVNGILATLTQKGITADDAITFLVNGMNKLSNPTEKTAKVLAELGFNTPRAAVGIRGFANVMGILTDKVKEGKLELTDLFNEIRGEKFASAYKTFQGEISKNTNEIGKNSFGTYNQAKDIVSESDADKVNKQINQLKNTLTASFGNELTSLLKGFIDASGGVDKFAASINSLVKVVIIGGTAFLTYKGILLGVATITSVMNGVIAVSTSVKAATTGATVAQTGSMAALTTSTVANTTATGVNTAAMRQNRAAYIAHPIGLLLAAAAALYAYYESQQYQIGQTNEKLLALNDTYDEVVKKQREVTADNVFDKYNADLNKASDQLKRLGDELAQKLVVANQELEKAKGKSLSTGQALQEGFGRYTNFMKDRISDVSREYNKFDDRIKASAKNILDLRETARENITGKQLKYAGGFEFDQFNQKEKIFTGELVRLKAEIQKLFTVGSDAKLGPTDEDLSKARELSKRYLDINKQRDELREDRSQRQLEEDVKKNPSSYRPDQYGKVYRGVSVDKLAGEQDAFVDFIERLEKDQQGRTKIKRDQDEKKILDSKDVLKKTENAFKALDDLRIFDQGGNPFAEFANKAGKGVDLDKVRVEFTKRAEAAKKSLDPEVLKKIGPEFKKLLDQRLDALEAEIKSTETAGVLTSKQNKAIESTKALSQAFQDGRKDIQEYGQEVEKVSGQLDQLVEGLKAYGGDAIEKVIAQNSRGANGIGNGTSAQRVVSQLNDRLQVGKTVGNLFDSLQSGNPFLSKDERAAHGAKSAEESKKASQIAKEKVAPIKAEAEAIQEAIRNLTKDTISKDGIKQYDPKVIEALLGRVRGLKEKVKETLRENLGGENVALPGVKSIPELDTIEEALQSSLKGAGEKFNKAVTSLDALRAGTNGVSTDLQTTLEKLNAIGPAATAAAGPIGTAFQTSSANLAIFNAQLDATLLKLQKLTAKPGEVPPIPPAIVPGFDKPSPKEGLAFGGMIHYAAGGPVGSDSRMVYAQPEEYIWNRTATRQFYSQISAMNRRGRTPVEFNQTSGDTIHMGGVTINESKSGSNTSADLLRTMKRQQRRG